MSRLRFSLFILQTPNANVVYSMGADDVTGASQFFGVDRVTGDVRIVQQLSNDVSGAERYTVRKATNFVALCAVGFIFVAVLL